MRALKPKNPGALFFIPTRVRRNNRKDNGEVENEPERRAGRIGDAKQRGKTTLNAFVISHGSQSDYLFSGRTHIIKRCIP